MTGASQWNQERTMNLPILSTVRFFLCRVKENCRNRGGIWATQLEHRVILFGLEAVTPQIFTSVLPPSQTLCEKMISLHPGKVKNVVAICVGNFWEFGPKTSTQHSTQLLVWIPGALPKMHPDLHPPPPPPVSSTPVVRTFDVSVVVLVVAAVLWGEWRWSGFSSRPTPKFQTTMSKLVKSRSNKSLHELVHDPCWVAIACVAQGQSAVAHPSLTYTVARKRVFGLFLNETAPVPVLGEQVWWVGSIKKASHVTTQISIKK